MKVLRASTKLKCKECEAALYYAEWIDTYFCPNCGWNTSLPYWRLFLKKQLEVESC